MNLWHRIIGAYTHNYATNVTHQTQQQQKKELKEIAELILAKSLLALLMVRALQSDSFFVFGFRCFCMSKAFFLFVNLHRNSFLCSFSFFCHTVLSLNKKKCILPKTANHKN